MSLQKNITCPISTDRINENVARVSAFYVIGVSLLGLFFNNWPIFVALAADFALRSLISGQWSPIRQVSLWTGKQLKLGQKPVDAAPKKFAAGVGLFFSLSIAFFIGLESFGAAFSFATILLICAFLEGFWGFCVGCIVYAKLILPFLKEKG